MPLPKIERGLLLPSRNQQEQTGVGALPFKQNVHVVGHEAVRMNGESKLRRVLQQLLTGFANDRGAVEVRPSVPGADSEVIPMESEVVECPQAWWAVVNHAADRCK